MAALLYEYRIPLLPTFVSFPIPGPILRDNARGSSLDSLVLYIIHLHELRLHEILEREREGQKQEKRKKTKKGEREMTFVLDRDCWQVCDRES